MDKILTYEKKNIFYSISGQGNALILLHGFLETHHIWDEFSENLSQKFTVICPDLPGFGGTDVFSDTHTMEFMAVIVKQILDHENIDSCVLLGHSMGGYVSLAFLEQYPFMLKGLVLFHSHASEDTKEARQNRERTIKIVESDKKDFINSFIPDLFAEGNVEKYNNKIEQLKEKARETSKEAVIAALRGMKMRKAKIDLLSNSTIPLKFFLGKEDSRIPFEKALAQAALPSHSLITVLGNVGHMGHIEEKKITLNSLRHFTSACFDE